MAMDFERVFVNFTNKHQTTMSLINMIVFSLNIKIEHCSALKIPSVSTISKIQNKLFFLYLF